MLTLPPFENEPTTDLTSGDHRRRFAEALERVRADLGRTHPLIIGGEEVATGQTLASVNPAHPDRVIGHHAMAGPEHVDRAVRAAAEAFPAWSRTPVEERAALLLRAAQVIRRRRHEISALMVHEVGKSWDEADGEAAEAIDLMEWYARQALRLEAGGGVTALRGESIRFRYVPLGVGAVISPWNFPLALMTGMTTAALVTGNTVVVKPAETSSTTAAWLVDVFRELQAPPGIVNLLTGRGEVAGAALVDHPGMRFIAFTGSREVGVGIYERAAKVRPGQRWLKRVQLELGGKNGILVDETADLDWAAEEIAWSAFGFQGQKCSAGSRAIVTRSAYDALVPRILDRARDLRVGDPVDPDVVVGPLIDGEAEEKVLDYVGIGRREGSLLLGGARREGEGHLVEPTVFGDVPADARIAQEEIFGPVLAVIPAKDFDDGIRIANGTEYGLTGSYFGRAPDRIARATASLHVGNLYVNRRSTGALMGVHPFGGFNLSGTDTKAGGPDYLLFFVQGQSVAERL